MRKMAPITSAVEKAVLTAFDAERDLSMVDSSITLRSCFHVATTTSSAEEYFWRFLAIRQEAGQSNSRLVSSTPPPICNSRDPNIGYFGSYLVRRAHLLFHGAGKQNFFGTIFVSSQARDTTISNRGEKAPNNSLLEELLAIRKLGQDHFMVTIDFYSAGVNPVLLRATKTVAVSTRGSFLFMARRCIGAIASIYVGSVIHDLRDGEVSDAFQL